MLFMYRFSCPSLLLGLFVIHLCWFGDDSHNDNHVFVFGQTNLFRGYSKKGDGIIESDVITTTLTNDLQFPLVGLGVGNLQHNLIEAMIYQSVQSSNKIRLFDTAHQSNNERDVSRGISTGIKAYIAALKTSLPQQQQQQRIQMHVVTKIWYTYLGYKRTRIAVDDIVKEFREAIKDSNVDLKLTILLHWPKCYDHIEWMNCEQEEQQLPDRVKSVDDPIPHLHKDTAWQQSWKALEDVYENPLSEYHNVIAAIGVSNFDSNDMQTLLETCRIRPHIIQINVWTLFNDPKYIEMLNENKIHIQVYNVMNGILINLNKNPNAHHHLLMIANQLEQQQQTKDTENTKIRPSQVVLKWLIQNEISIIPRTSNPQRLHDNSDIAILNIPNMNSEQLNIVQLAMTALLNNRDMDKDVKVRVRFHAKSHDMYVFWIADNNDHGREKQIAYIEKGSSYQEHTHPGHHFKVYNAYNPDQYQTYAIQGQYGDSQEIHVEL